MHACVSCYFTLITLILFYVLFNVLTLTLNMLYVSFTFLRIVALHMFVKNSSYELMLSNPQVNRR